MRKYDYTFLEQDKIPGNLINVLTGIYTMKVSNDNRKDKFENIFTEFEKLQLSNPLKDLTLLKES